MKFAGLAVVIVLSLVSCNTVPILAKLEPAFYEDEFVRIDYRIGVKIYFITITNKTQAEIGLVPSRTSVVSVDGQTGQIPMILDDAHIPPRATLVISSARETFFNTDINAPFRPQAALRQHVSPISDADLIKQFMGRSFRIYLPLVINGVEKLYDLILLIVDVGQ